MVCLEFPPTSSPHGESAWFFTSSSPVSSQWQDILWTYGSSAFRNYPSETPCMKLCENGYFCNQQVAGQRFFSDPESLLLLFMLSLSNGALCCICFEEFISACLKFLKLPKDYAFLCDLSENQTGYIMDRNYVPQKNAQRNSRCSKLVSF